MRIQQASLTSTPRRNVSLKENIYRKKTITYEHHERKKRRKPGVVAAKQIKFYQSTTDFLIRLRPFARIVKEIGDAMSPEFSQYRWQPAAIECLQWATEHYMVALLEDVNKAATHAKRVTIRPEDLHLVRDIRCRDNPNEM